jgi:hypothetical protein
LKGIEDVAEEGSVPPHTGPRSADRQECQRMRSEHPTQRPVTAAFTGKSLPPTLRPADEEEDTPTINGRKDDALQRHRPSPTPEPSTSAGATLVRRFGTLIGQGDGDKSKPKRGSVLIPQSPPRNEPTLNENRFLPQFPTTYPMPRFAMHPVHHQRRMASQLQPVGGFHRRIGEQLRFLILV